MYGGFKTSILLISYNAKLPYNYGYNFENWQEHPCRCGAKNCIGYILAEDHWPKLKRELAKREKGQTGG